mgnify:CR=1 FL=1
MTRPKNQYCKSCEERMSRMYYRPTGGNYTPIGFLCKCGEVLFDANKWGRKV